MKLKILAFLAAATMVATAAQASTQPGWGSKTTQRTIGGILGGATIGGIIGHQHDKQKEGIIIGTVLGGLIGNRSGANKDYRNAQKEQAAWEAQKRRQAAEQARWEQQRRARTQTIIHTPVYTGSNSGSLHNDPEIVAARQRAEQLELELQRQQQARERALQKQRLLQEYADRQARASQQLGNSQY